jgi:hypothetical protein
MASEATDMATGRALTTETEREYLRGEHGDQRMYEARSRVKARIDKQLSGDIEFFEEEAPELLEALREVACPDDQ